jgi:hypothetical protein
VLYIGNLAAPTNLANLVLTPKQARLKQTIDLYQKSVVQDLLNSEQAKSLMKLKNKNLFSKRHKSLSIETKNHFKSESTNLPMLKSPLG